MLRCCLLLSVISLPWSAARGQSLEQRVGSIDSGTVHFSFAARPGVCGNGGHGISISDESDDWEMQCEDGPVRVALKILNHRVVAIRTFVGGHWRTTSSSTDLGTIPARGAASYLLKLAADGSELSGDPVLPATLADSVIIWPDLLRLARSTRVPGDRRRTAVFWLSQAAGDAVDHALDSIAGDQRGDREIRKQAVFALSQRSSAEAIPMLIRVARTNPDPELRRTALFWLGQSDDPRALDLFEQILTP